MFQISYFKFYYPVDSVHLCSTNLQALAMDLAEAIVLTDKSVPLFKSRNKGFGLLAHYCNILLEIRTLHGMGQNWEPLLNLFRKCRPLYFFGGSHYYLKLCFYLDARDFDSQYMLFLELLLENAIFSVLFYVLDFKNLVFCVLLRSFESVLSIHRFFRKNVLKNVFF